VTGAQDQPVLALDHDGQGIGAGELVERGLERLQRRLAAFQLGVDQVRDDLAVRVALEDTASPLHLGLEFREVLDDSVVHHRDPAGLVRVGVLQLGLSVGGPSGVAHAHRGLHGIGGDRFLQGADLALRPSPHEPAALNGGDAGGVIAPVLQPLQALDQAGRDGGLAHDADDAAHELVSGRNRLPNFSGERRLANIVFFRRCEGSRG
jgi:hypothetical protein